MTYKEIIAEIDRLNEKGIELYLAGYGGLSDKDTLYLAALNELRLKK